MHACGMRVGCGWEGGGRLTCPLAAKQGSATSVDSAEPALATGNAPGATSTRLPTPRDSAGTRSPLPASTAVSGRRASTLAMASRACSRHISSAVAVGQ